MKIRAKLKTGEEVELSQTDFITPKKWLKAFLSQDEETEVSIEGKIKDGRDFVLTKELDPESFHKPEK